MRDLLIEIIDKYMTIHKATRFSKIKAHLPHKMETLQELVQRGFVWEGTNIVNKETYYLPRMLAFEAVNEPRRRQFAYKLAGKLLFALRDKTRQGRPEGQDGEVIEGLTVVLALDFPKYIKQIRSGHFVRQDSVGDEVDFVVVSKKDALAGKYKDVETGLLAFPTSDINDFEDVGVAWDEELKRRGLDQYIEKRTSLPKLRQTQTATHGAVPSLFSFVQDSKLRAFIERDFEDLKQARLWGSLRLRFVIAGGLIEALLLDALMSHPAILKTAACKREGRTPEYWSLGSLLDAAAELRLLRTTVEKLGSPVREFRNLVHPGVEWRSGTVIEIEEVEIVERVLDLVIRDLSRQRTQNATP